MKFKSLFSRSFFLSRICVVACIYLFDVTPALAVWEYSAAAKLAIYDGVEQECRHLVPALFDEVKDRLIFLEPEEKLQADQLRQSAEYFQVLQEIRQSASSKLPDGSEKIKECTADLIRFKRRP